MLLLNVYDHLLVDIRIPHDGTKLLERDSAVFILVCEQNRLVDDLLQLRFFEVVANHHFEHMEEFSVRDVSVVVHIVDPEGKPQLAFFITFHAELTNSLDKLCNRKHGSAGGRIDR